LIAQTIFERSLEKSSAAEQVQVITPAAGDHDDVRLAGTGRRDKQSKA